MTIIMTHEYVPPGGDPKMRVQIHAMKEYQSGVHDGRVDHFRLELPEGMLLDLPRKFEFTEWKGVTTFLTQWFPGEVEAGVKDRMTRVWFDPVQYPLLAAQKRNPPPEGEGSA